REIRRRTGMSQRVLAAAAGVTPATVARIEKGRMEPTFDLLQRIARGAGTGLHVEVSAIDPDEQKAKRQARMLTHEQRLKQNDHISRIRIAGTKRA
ncbi:MAG: helix-turn-helix transcriptional regulator, partial [Actinomycetota bacterium]